MTGQKPLFHYTCRDGLAGIRRADWLLQPNLHPLLGARLVWLTDLAEPDAAALGLIGHTVACDRTEYRLTAAETHGVLPWWRWCRRAGITRARRDLLELATGARPLRWWVSDQPLRAVPL